MNSAESKMVTTEYHPRRVESLGHWSLPCFAFKIYGLSELSDPIGANARSEAQAMALLRLADIKVDQSKVHPGFIIYHKGSAGITLQVHWWVEGCVLCHDHVRLVYEGVDPIASVRPYVVGCVWEMALLNHERVAWQNTMMGETPSASDYLDNWLEDTSV